MPFSKGQPPLRQRLAYKQTRNIVLVAFIIGLLLTGGQLMADYFQQKNNHDNDVERILSTAIKSAQFAAYNLDDATAGEIVAGLLNNRFIVKASIKDNYKNTLAHASKAPEKVSGVGRWLFGDLEDIQVSLLHTGTEEVGVLYIQVDPANESQAFIQRSLLTFLFGIIRNIILAACIMLVFYFGVTKSVLLASQQVSKPEKLKNIDIPNAHRDDEIGMLLNAFNQQLKTIETQHEQILTANKNLEAQVLERTHELKKEQQSALAASKAKSDFLAVMSHEIRTPMNGILGLLRLLSDSGLPNAQAQYVDSINDACESLLGLMNNALEYTRNEQGELELVDKVFDLERLISSIIFLMGSSAKKNQNQLSYHIANNVDRYYELDSERLRQVILNLINNAIKFTRDGEIHLEVSCLEKKDGCSLLRFLVSDTGVGIAEQAKEKIFSPYQQADKSIHALYGGAGMGLAICKAIVDKMDGELNFSSQEGEGAEFWFEVSAKVAQKMPALSHEGGTASMSPLRVLVADDVEMNLKLAKIYFEQNKHKVYVAENGLEAISLCEAEQPQLVLMDVNMPELDGISATEKLRQADYCGTIYGVTAHIDPETKTKCYAAGMDGVIEKPVDYGELLNSINQDFAKQNIALNKSVIHEHFNNLGIEPAAQLYEKALQELRKNISAEEGVLVGKPLSNEQLHKLRGLAGNFGLQAMLDLFDDFDDDDGILSPATYALWIKTMRITQGAINQYQPNKM
ncbi:ATP-binding protein [uncultured Pseudoteredinibacter sp.]|uniref:ATP-binding protein n=1 Tax=uncultured Pseudoteredinibacter sp. TaxID=1641701 RepID=UPI00263687FF|nr:ATP-binding protein [uncultured Pseudoteredinibacter sp.]